MSSGRRILAGSVLLLAASGVVAGAAVSAFANGPATEWGHPAAFSKVLNSGHAVLASDTNFSTPSTEWTGPASLSNPTAVEYANYDPAE